MSTLVRGAAGLAPSRDELAKVRNWVAARFQGEGELPPPDPGLQVLSNYDPVQKNARFGRPLRSGQTEFSRGLFCHAPSRLVVRLPGPGRSFAATVGVDSNEQTRPGRGSVVFSARCADREAFRSEVLREGMAPVPVQVDLAGAREFTLEVGDGGDGIGCDQADWAEARITLQDGSEVWLDELTLPGSPCVADAAQLPIAFLYGGRPSAELLKAWPALRASRRLDAQRTEHTVTCADPETGLVVRCVAVEYLDYPTVEWTLYLKNTGAKDTPLLEGVQSLDLTLTRGHYGEFVLHHAVGSPCAPNDYGPLRTVLPPSAEKRLGGAGGRPTNSDLSYVSVEAPIGGLIIVVGWPGQWAAQFTRDAAEGLRVRAGQELTHFVLHPGEEVRTPLMVLQFWDGDWIRAQNLWRRWMLAHNVPRPAGKLPEPELFGCSSHLFNEMVDANEGNQKQCIDRYLEERLGINRWWMDAGWYPCAGVGWPKTGTWEVDAKRFPNGLRAISDHAHAKGLKTILWFEPERVHPGTWLSDTHPEWVLGGQGGGLLDLGNPEARQWLTDHVDRLLTEQGIDLYRQDLNLDPLAYWRGADAEDRQGITEIRHVEGYLAYWDELRRRHPAMLIDTCASGGRRNDLETLRRAVPLWRTDWRGDPVGTQSCTYGISFWIPLSGTGAVEPDTYCFRSNMTPFTNCLWDIRDRSLNYDLLRRLTTEFRQVAQYWTGDFYPLTGYSVENDVWLGWQFDRPDLGEGMVQVFRRAESPYLSAQVRLRGLDPAGDYTVTDLDEGQPRSMSGRELLDPGLTVTIPSRPGAALLTYKRAVGQ
jgi:alpha-galactosidase